MKVFVAGVDGYLGWTMAQYLAARKFEVCGADAFLRREWVAEVGSHSAIPIASMQDRLLAFTERYGKNLQFRRGDLREYNFVLNCLRSFRPDAIVHFAEMPSAPYSMMDIEHCAFTQTNNIVTTLNLLFAMKEACPKAHMVKLGTMGVYGTPNIDIPEGFFEIEFRGRRDRLPFPRQAGSWYHQSKVHDSHNVMFACRLWELRSTDIMQGVVFGTQIPEMENDERLLTRFDFDQCFGTAVNRYCAQAVIGEPITPFGTGEQRRGFIPLQDSMQCLTIAIENPPDKGEYRVFNQFQDVYEIGKLARLVEEVARELDLPTSVRTIENPRSEAEGHYYNPDHKHLLELGYQPTQDVRSEIKSLIRSLLPYRDRIRARREVLLPDIRWEGVRRRSEYLDRE